MSKQPQDNAPFIAALAALAEQGVYLTAPEPFAENTWTCNAPKGWSAAAREIAARLPGGMVLPGGGLVWMWGRTPLGRLVHRAEAHHQTLWQARDALAQICGPESAEGVYSVGTAAKRLWRWVAPPDPSTKKLPIRGKEESAEDYLRRLPLGERWSVPGQGTAYHDCKPGVYSDMTMWDVSRAYYSLLYRVAEDDRAGLRPRPSKGGRAVSWGEGWQGEERERYRDALAGVVECRPLRQAMWGIAMGSYAPKGAFVPDPASERGYRQVMIRPGPGPFRPLALLIARTMRDLAAAESCMSDSVYSNTDSVVVESGKRPALWESFGLSPEVRVRGNCEVCGLGRWAFFAELNPESPEYLAVTEPYKLKVRHYEPRPRVAQPKGAQIFTQWL